MMATQSKEKQLKYIIITTFKIVDITVFGVKFHPNQCYENINIWTFSLVQIFS